MYMSSNLRAAYGQQPQQMRPARSVEYDLLARATHQLREAAARAKAPAGYPALVAALAENTRIWGVFAADVADQGNTLPAPLRAKLFYLYEFTLQHSRKVQEGFASAEVLVEINTAVMRGLRGDAGAGAA
jgi:flagellar protein FlaF